MKRCVLSLAFDEDRQILVRILPQCEEVLVGFPGFRRVACQSRAPRQTEVGNGIVQPPIPIEPAPTPTGTLVIHNLLELGGGLRPLIQT